jgi:KUP system potassium uptake protein
MKAASYGPLSAAHAVEPTHRGPLFSLMVGALGVVFGDIGTSPLYALQVSLSHLTAGDAWRSEVLGLVSLLIWALIFTITAKYVTFVMRMDNRGEGGILSLMALAQTAIGRRTTILFLLSISGAALFYGDAIITPAISVLSAIEGLKLVVSPDSVYAQFISDYCVIPLTLAVVAGLFVAQSGGTARVGAWFGPIMVVWFVLIAIAGVVNITDDPYVLTAANPLLGLSYLIHHGKLGLVTLGSVFLAVTGGEALYADMGHFGRIPINRAWLFMVLPALLFNYLGQGALVLSRPDTVGDPFYNMMPHTPFLLIPMILLATAATVIASQATISGTFSLTQQAIQLGFLPRLQILHTSDTQAGQIYMPRVNALLFVGVIALVLAFRSSVSLASAYGIAVSGTMMITTPLAFMVAWRLWKWPLWQALAVCAPFAVIDVVFFVSNALKFFDGGYVPVTIALVLMLVMGTWARGVRIVNDRQRRESVPLEGLMKSLERSKPTMVPGTAVYLTTTPDSAPTAFLHNLKHNKIIHAKNVVLTIKSAEVPRIPVEEQLRIERVTEAMLRMTATIGYMQTPDVPRLLMLARKQNQTFDIMQTSFFLSRFNLKTGEHGPLQTVLNSLFIMLTRTANDATDFLRIPPGRVVWMGGQLTL